MGIEKKNPFRVFYLGIAVICCVTLSIIFCCTYYIDNFLTQKQNNQKKTELLTEDLEAQLRLMEGASVRIAISNEYQPFHMSVNKYNEQVLLEDFEQYRFYTALSDECFLYYGGDTIFHSSGHTMALEIYPDQASEEEKEEFREALETCREGTVQKALSASRTLYILFPLRVSASTGRTGAVLGFAVEFADLEERFQMVSGGIGGKLALYRGEELLYANQEPACGAAQKNVLSADTQDGLYRLCYLPEGESYLASSLFLSQLLLVLGGIIFLFMIANLFAKRLYRPIAEISDRYRKEISMPEDVSYENALAEIDGMMERMLKDNARFGLQIEQKQAMLKNQILKRLLEGSASFDVFPYLNRLNIRLPGPYYYVVTISFERESGVEEEFLQNLVKELEQISDEEEKEYVYAICDFRKKQLNVICSIAREMRRDELAEIICGLAESFAYEPLSGCGNVYQDLARLSASWLESMDNVHGGEDRRQQEEGGEMVQGKEALYRICRALGDGNEEGALKGLESLMSDMDHEKSSLLMQQYVFAGFISEVSRQAERCGIALSNRSISLVISARNTESFRKAAEELIHDFCGTVTRLKNTTEETQSRRILEYVQMHFAEYDMTIEKAAEDLKVTTAVVRQAILEQTGKMYKDYLMSLRIDYAKRLLRENLTVDETCRKVGYSSLSYFTKLFKEATGVTPARYKHGETGEDR